MRVARVAVPLALAGLATTGVVAFAVPGSDAQTAVPAPATSVPDGAALREQPVSRDLQRTPSPTPVVTPSPTPTPSPTVAPTTKPTTRPATTKKATEKPAGPTAEQQAAHPKVSGSLWSTDELNIRTDPSKKADVVTVVPAATKLSVTSVRRDGYRLVVFKGEGRWVTAQYLSEKKPKVAASDAGGVTNAPCGKGSAMERGLTPDAVLVHRTVCARFPQVSSFGGTRGGGGFHGSGQAVDCMISDSTAGWALARWVRAHARELGVSEVIYSQKIWTVQRSGEGWRSMSDRGSATANHYDHVHVSVYGHWAA
ncbi:hypothetical protein SAMN05421756_108243 [Microlunatus flavus]|uniref:ARB-07466-like C-terminal domain-containing protein n=1 Tax=Microlunatus flavus TaxID=1036181 RepID=A0A1H9LBJ1_9ACTN|nr:hypothetical protein SAMN05421756_108243 [Microlunatus flavus]